MVDQFYGEHTPYDTNDGQEPFPVLHEEASRHTKGTAHGLTVLAIVAVFTFVLPSDQTNRWFWNLLQWGGLASACAAVALYDKVEGEEEQRQNTFARQIAAVVTGTTARLQEHYERQLYQVQLQHQDERQQIHEQYLAAAQQQVEQLTDRYQQQLQLFRAQTEQAQGLALELEQQKEALNLELTQVQAAALEQLHQERDQIAIKEMQFQRQREQLEAEREQLQQEHSHLDQWLAEQKQGLRQQQEALETRETVLEARLTEQYQSQLQALQERERALSDRELAFEEQLERRVFAEEARIKELEVQMGENFERLWAEREQLYSTVANKAMTEAYQLKQPDHTRGATHEELLADKVIDMLYKHGIVVKRPVVEPKPHNKFELVFTILPVDPLVNQSRGADEPAYITNMVDAFKLIDTRLFEGVKAVVPGCESKPKVEMVYGGIKLTIDISGIDWEAQAKERERARQPQVVEADPNWVLAVAEIGNHFRITGPTDSGKSVLADNLVGALRAVFGDLSVTLADPKYPFTEWTTFDPNYKGADECLAGVGKLERLVDSRFIQARQDKDAQRPIREFPAELFALDEAEILTDEARLRDDIDPPGRGQLSMQRNLSRMLRKGLKLGRGLTKKKGKGLKVLYVAQSPLCSRLGLNRDDFDQSVNIFIGDNIPRALEEELKGKVSANDKAFWLEQYHLRVARGDQYFCLVKMPGKRPFLATMPVPGTYAVHDVATAVLSEPEPVEGTIREEELDSINLDGETQPELFFDPSQPLEGYSFDEGQDLPGSELDWKLPYLNSLPPEEAERLLKEYGSNLREGDAQDDFKASIDGSVSQVDEVAAQDQGLVSGEVDNVDATDDAAVTGSDQLDQAEAVEADEEDKKVLPPSDPENAEHHAASNPAQPLNSSSSSDMNSVSDETNPSFVLPWSLRANPTKLFESAKGRMTQLVQQGYTKPFEICLAIWGQTVSPYSKPYNGKAGVKVLVERLIQELTH